MSKPSRSMMSPGNPTSWEYCITCASRTGFQTDTHLLICTCTHWPVSGTGHKSFSSAYNGIIVSFLLSLATTHTHKQTYGAALHWPAAPYLKHTLRTQKHTFQVFNGAYVMCVSETSLCTLALRKARIVLGPVWLCSVCLCVFLLLLQTHLLSVFFLDRLEVGPEVHGDFVLGAQQRAEDGVSGHTNASEIRPLEFPPEVQHLYVQVFNLDRGEREKEGD